MQTPSTAWESASTGKRVVELVRWLRVRCRRWRARTPRQLRLCETLALGERRFVAVVQFEQQRFLIGGTGTAVALLASLPAVKAKPVTEAVSPREEEQA